MSAFDEIRSRVRLADVFTLYNLRPNRAGYVCCPLHADNTASLKVYTDNWYCYSCNAGGDAVKLVTLIDNLKPIDAARRIDNTFSLGLFTDKPLTPAELRQAAELTRKRAEDKQLVGGFEQQYSEIWDFITDYCRICEKKSGDYKSNDFLYMDHLFFEMMDAQTITERIKVFFIAKRKIGALLEQHAYGWKEFFNFEQ